MQLIKLSYNISNTNKNMQGQLPLHLKYEYHVPIFAQYPSWSCNTRS